MPKNILIDGAGDRLAGLAQKCDGKPRQDGNQQDLQQVAAGQRAEIAVGNDREQMRNNALFLGLGDVGRDGIRIDCGRVDVEATAGLKDLSDDEADGQRDRRDDFEIDQGLEPDTADALQIAHRRNAVHDRAEDHRRDHHLDQGDEAVAERLQLLAEMRVEPADNNAKRYRDQHLHVEDSVPWLMTRGGTGGFSSHGIAPGGRTTLE